MTIISDVGDFIDELGSHLESLDLGLTKGTNLFDEIIFEEEDTPAAASEGIVLYDLGYATPDRSFGYYKLEWSVRILATRQSRIASIEALRAPTNALVEARAFSAPGFKVKNVRIDTAPEFVVRLTNGRFQAQAILIFTTIPTG